MLATPSTEEVCAAIVAGRVNLGEVHKAIRAAIEKTVASLEWVLNLDGLGVAGLSGEVTASELPLGVCADVMKETGRSWADLDPIKDPRDAEALIVAMATYASDEDATAVRRQVRGLKAQQIVDAYRLEEVRPADPS